MKIKFYTNAGLEIIADKTRILCDPWFIPGAFDGSWFQYPPLVTKPEDLTEYTHVYISHIHPDHCDPRTLIRLKNKDVPVIILKGQEEFLKKRLASCGFLNFIELADKETKEIASGVYVTMYSAFTPSAFVEDAEVPNVIDSSIVVSDAKTTIFNANDNMPTKAACDEILKTHKEITVALLPYSGVGPYPSSYDHLTVEEKKIASEGKKEKYLNRFIENVQTLKPKFTVPCAGQMILGGRQSHKNEVLGIPPVLKAKTLLDKNNFSSVVLEEGDILNSENFQVLKTIKNKKSENGYIKEISGSLYWWENAFNIPREEQMELMLLLKSAYGRMRSYQNKYGFKKDWFIGITALESADFTYIFSMEKDEAKKIKTNELFNSKLKFLQVKIPYNYLIAILNRHCHWNNAYHGCQVEWYRRPDEYLPEIQMLLSYFHL